ncbi:hypothetical protein ATANTOWER_015203 [Ataeniobius toweri]|uniref:Uncharacterized protein n=1 Tax=Ataeniobius toweri TaxID=208326 RepID=A0ABU7AR69_9TELE|nr:hypothetical protein [Ataeniobius toweri]
MWDQSNHAWCCSGALTVRVHQRNILEEETVSVAAGFSRQRSVAPPEGRSVNSLCAGCVGSAEILAALFLTLDLYKSWMEGRSALIILHDGSLVDFALIFLYLV